MGSPNLSLLIHDMENLGSSHYQSIIVNRGEKSKYQRERQYFIVTMEENLCYMYFTKIKNNCKKIQVTVIAMKYLD